MTKSRENPPYFIHQSSIADAQCQIGAGTKIWHFSHVRELAVIGQWCIIGQNVYIDQGVVIGNRVKIQNNVSIYNPAVVEDDVFIGPSVVFTNVKTPRAFIESKHNFSPTLLKNGATVGANVTIVCGVTIGQYAFIGAGSVVTKNVPAHGLVYGTPAQSQGFVCICGERLPVRNEKIACLICSKTYLIDQNICQYIQ